MIKLVRTENMLDLNDTDEIGVIIKNNDIEDTSFCRKRIKSLIDTQKKTGIINDKVFDKSNIEWGGFPTATNELKILNACWKRVAILKELGTLMPQSAASVRDLHNRGYQFKREPHRKENERYYLTKIGDKNVKCRTIYGVDENKKDKERPSNYIKVSLKEIRKIKKGSRDPLTTDTVNPEIDHRKPVIRSIRENESPGYFYKKDLKDSKWKEKFQVISKKNNNIKTRKCEDSLYNNTKIEIPEVFQKMQNASIFQLYCKDDNSCSYCFWANLDRIGDFIEKYKGE